MSTVNRTRIESRLTSARLWIFEAQYTLDGEVLFYLSSPTGSTV